MPAGIPQRRQLSRRDVLRLSTAAAFGSSLPGQIQTAAAATGRSHPATAKNCIYIFLCGGPSQLEMWDPKPKAPEAIRGPFGTIQSSVPGLHLGGLLPQVSQQAHRFSIIRSMHVDTNVHDIGIFRTLLANKVGSAKNKPYPPDPSDHPAIGAILHKLLGAQNTMLPWAVIPRYFTTGDRFYKGQTAGFLGTAYEPFCLDTEKKDSLGRSDFTVKNAELFGEEITAARFAARSKLLQRLETNEHQPAGSSVQSMRDQYDNAINMLTSAEFKNAFDVSREPKGLRESYGMNEYGQSFLLARRLVERDVRMVNLFWTFYGSDGCQFNLWDNHGTDKKDICGGVSSGVEMLKHDYCLPSFDRAFSTLLSDLDDRGLLEETLVVVVGEFGRTPKINKNSGRDHWGSCYSAVLAGGGVRGGQVYGSSDAQAAYIKDSPVSPYDLHATVLHAFGFGPEVAVPDPTDRPVRISDGLPVTELF